MSEAPVNDAVVFRGAYVVANGVLCLSFLLLTTLAARVVWRGELTTWRLRIFFGFVLASVLGTHLMLSLKLKRNGHSGAASWASRIFKIFCKLLACYMR
jgi:hypothetical protein